MDLFFRKTGEGSPLIILHGLYGSSDNWMSIAKLLEKHFEIYIPDQRNHGRSPHSDDFNYQLLTNDIHEFFIKNNIKKATLLGHSMGGKAAIHFARQFPELLSSLIVIDIAPKNYSLTENPEYIGHLLVLDALQKLDVTKIVSREEADKMLSLEIPKEKLRSFLLKNLKRNSKGKYEWMLNLDSLQKNFYDIATGFDPIIWDQTEITGFPVLFVKGGLSTYISTTGIPAIYKIFPGAEIFEIENTGHWLHAEKPEELTSKIRSFILEK